MSEEEFAEKRHAKNIWKYVPPLLILLGTFGNILTITVLSKRRSRSASTARYLCALAVSDILVLYSSLLPNWIRHAYGFSIRSVDDFVCITTVFIGYLSMHCSSWILVAVTCERFFAVYFPYKAKRTCTKKTSLVVIGATVLFFTLLNCHFLFGAAVRALQVDNGTKIKVDLCTCRTEGYCYFIDYIYYWIFLCMVCIIPLVVLVLGNVSIIVKLISKRQKTKANDVSLHICDSEKNIRFKKSSSITALLVLLSVVFFINMTPMPFIMAAGQYFADSFSTPADEAVADLSIAIAYMFLYLNSAINFILYFLSGPKFRSEVKKIFGISKCCDKGSEQTSSTFQTNLQDFGEKVVVVNSATN